MRLLFIIATLHMSVYCRELVSNLQLMAAPVIEGVRMPDDASDVIIHRNGKFFINSFIPGDSTVSIKLDEPRKTRGQAVVKLRRRGRSRFSDDSPQHDTSSPVYYTPEEPGLIHSDRSPYSFEPAATGLLPPGLQERLDQHGRPLPGIMTASNEDFIIREHTYKMCPECPTFSIPIPIPKSAVIEEKNDDLSQDHHGQESDKSILGKVRGFVWNARSSVTNFVSNILHPMKKRVVIEKRISRPTPATVSPLAIAGLAVLGLGVATLVSAGGGASGRGFSSEDFGAELATNSLYSLPNLDYNSLDPLCTPRNYCETLKRKKYLIDQFPVAKRVGVRLAEIVWDRDHVSERGEESLCNLRECVFSLLR